MRGRRGLEERGRHEKRKESRAMKRSDIKGKEEEERREGAERKRSKEEG